MASSYNFPQKAPGLKNSEHGIASLTHKGRTFRFRTNPNQFSWTYTLNKRVDQTYGGRVIQLLGTKIDDFVFKADSGGGRWGYSNSVAKFLRDIMVDQRGGEPAVFEYTKRGWKLNCYVVSVPFQDEIGEVLREFEITCKVQEDVSNILTKNSLDAELSRLKDGLGYRRTRYNDPTMQDSQMVDLAGDFAGSLNLGELTDALQGIIPNPTSSQFLSGGQAGLNYNGIPGLGNTIGR